MSLRFDHIFFSYNDRPLLTDISFKVEPSEIVGIIGPNGSGKTTLIKLALGLLKPSQGNIYINEKNITKIPINQLAKFQSYVPQVTNILFSQSVFYTVLMGRRPYIQWSYGEVDKKIVLDTLSLLGISHLKNRSFTELSGGEKQKTILARAVAQGSKLMLLDEPTSDLDLKHQQDVMNSLRFLACEKKVAVLMAIHDLNLASQYCDRLILLDDGAIVANASPFEVLTEKNIEDTYEVRVEIISVRNKPHISSIELKQSNNR